MSFFGFGQTADIEIVFDDADKRKVADVKTDDGKKEKLLLYYDGEAVTGKVNVTLRKPGSKLEHQGIKVELIGQIELFYDRGNHHEFISLVKELARPGDLLQHTSYPFEFANVDKPYEVYTGSNVRLRYFLRATIVRRLTDVVKEVDVAVHTLCSYPDMLNSIKMEVGIEDCLHIEFEYNKSKYHLKDVIVGKIYFLLVRIKIKHMEISIIKRETTGTGPNTFTENETVAKYEIMDGAPVKGESIPIRVFLAGYDLTPTMRDINNKFSVRYYLNLVLMDTEDRRYFKQQEVTLWRKSDKSRLPLHNQHEQVITTRGKTSHDDSQQTASPLHIENTFVRTMPLEHPEIRNGPSPMEEDIICSREIEKKLTDTHINEERFPEIIEEKKGKIIEKSKKAERQLEPPLLADRPLIDPPVLVNQEPKMLDTKIENVKTETPSITIKQEIMEEPQLVVKTETPSITNKQEIMEEPQLVVKTETPSITIKQEIMEEPQLVEKPPVSEKPLISVKPDTSDKPLTDNNTPIVIKQEILENPQESENTSISVKIEKAEKPFIPEKPHSTDKFEPIKKTQLPEKPQRNDKPETPEKPKLLEKPLLVEKLEK